MNKFFRNAKYDLPASIVVFLVALPLCLGIALASNAPLFSGIIAGIVGGIIVGAISGSQLGVSGPAAGLAIIVVNYVTILGSWPAFLAALTIAGIIQFMMGVLRLGSIAYYFPSAVIKGMLFGIGVIIIIKQIPHAIGYDLNKISDSEEFIGEASISYLKHSLLLFSTPIIFLSLLSILLMVIWENFLAKKHQLFKAVPAPLLVIIIGIICGTFINLHDHQIVQIPISKNLTEFLGNFSRPDFSMLKDPNIYLMALVIALVASIETLLCVEATDRLDPLKRITPTNQELKAQGIGNIVCGLIGGLPVTQVIVRSSANVSFGAKTKLSAIAHGVLILVCAITIPGLLNKIPLASLAAILLLVGYKLANPMQIKQLYQRGFDQFFPFIVTVTGIVFMDLLKGVSLGMLCSIGFILYNNFKYSFSVVKDKTSEENSRIIRLSEHMSFLNKGALIKALSHPPANSKLLIDGTNSKFIDHDIREIIKDFEIGASNKNIDLTIRPTGLKNPYNALTKEIRDSLTPQKALELLKEGNKRFVGNLAIDRNLLKQVNDTAEEQHPFAIILSCIDSRTSAELIFDQGLGDIFSCRIAGNVLNEDIIGSMEFACKIAGAKLIMVLGHSGCGAIKGACSDVKMGHLTGLLDKIRTSNQINSAIKNSNDKGNPDFVDHISSLNVKNVLMQIPQRSTIIQGMANGGDILLVGGMYNVGSGLVEFFDYEINFIEE